MAERSLQGVFDRCPASAIRSSKLKAQLHKGAAIGRARIGPEASAQERPRQAGTFYRREARATCATADHAGSPGSVTEFADTVARGLRRSRVSTRQSGRRG